MNVIVNDLLVEYDTYGDPSHAPLIILHGWGDSAAGWRHFARALARDHYVVVPSLPGFGASQAPPTPWDIPDFAAHVAAFCLKLQLQPAIVVGHSNGGSIAIYLAAEHMVGLQKLVLLASAGVRTPDSAKLRGLKAAAKTGKVLTAALPGRVQQKLRRKMYLSIGSDLLVAEHMQETFKRIVRYDVQHDAKRITVPTLLVYGGADTATPPQFGSLLHGSIPGSTLEVIDGARHFVHQDASAQVLRLVSGFVQ